MEKVMLVLGGNQGNRQAVMESALQLLSDCFGECIEVSSFYETEAWGFESEQPFINLAAIFKTELSPSEGLSTCLDIEKELGRKRVEGVEGYQSRIIDIDIILWGQKIINAPELCVPHPLMHKRLFVLKPCAEIAEKWEHPLLESNIKNLLLKCKDKSKVAEFSMQK